MSALAYWWQSSVGARGGVSPDVSALVSALGGDGAVAAFYDYRFGVQATGGVVDSWSDSRGIGPALSVTGSARPLLGASGVTFDGVDDYLRASGGTLNGFGDPMALFLVAVMPAAQDAAINRRLVVLSSGTTEALRAYIALASNGYNIIGQPTNTTVGNVVGLSGTRLLQGRRTAGLVAGQIGSAAEVSTSAAQTATTVTRLTIAGAASDVSVAFAGFTLKALGVTTTGLSSAQWSAIQAWAQAVHGATL